MAAAALTCLAASLAAGAVGLLDAGVRVEGRTRHGTGGASWEAEADPVVAVGATAPRGRVSLLYAPRLLVQQDADGSAVLHRLTLEGQLRPDRRWLLRLAGGGSIGTTDLLLDQGRAAAAGGAPQPVPASPRLEVAGASLALSAEGTLARRVRSRFHLSAWTEGGRTAEAELQLPRQRAARATGYAEVAWTRHDALAAELRLAVTRVRPGQVDWLAGVGASWRRRLEDRPEPRTPEQLLADADPAEPDPEARPRELHDLPEVWLGLGTAVDALRGRAPERIEWNVYPTAEAGYRRRLGGTLEASAEATLTPAADRYGGRTSPLARGGGRLTWRPGRAWIIGVDAALGVVVTGAREGESVAGGGLRVSLTLAPGWDVAAGTRAWRQRRGEDPTVRYLWTFLELSCRERLL